MAAVDTGVSASTLEALERDFEDVIRDLGGEDNLERFRLEYEKLHRALKKSHESERRLVKKCQELSQEIMANSAKIQSAIKMSQGDHNTIEAFKAQIEKAWKMVDGAHEKEARAKETIQQLKKEAATLSALVEKGAALTHGQELSLAQLTEENNDLMRERDALSTKIGQQLHEIKEKSEAQQQLDTSVRQKDEELRKVTAKLADLRRDFEREVKSKDRADGQAKELMQVLQARNNEAEMRSTALSEKATKVERLTALILEESTKKNELMTALQTQESQLHDIKKAVEDMRESAESRDAAIAKLERDIEERDKEILVVRYEEQKTQKAKDQRIKLLKKVKQEQEDIEREHVMLQRQIVGLEHEIQAIAKEREKHSSELKKVESAKRVIDGKAESERTQQAGIEKDIAKHVDVRTKMADELKALKREITHHTSEVLRLESERERFAELASEANVKFQGAEREKKIAEMREGDLQKQIEEAAKELVAQQSKYEQVRSDRNLYSKNLIEAQDEISEMKQKFKIMDHQIDQLKEELAMKEKKHFEAETNYKSLKEKLAKLRKRTNTLMEQYKEATSRSESLSQEIKQLTKVINQCDTELSQQQEQFLEVTNQRDILGTQLIRRNDELALLYEKIRIQQSTLRKGEAQYADRLRDIQHLNFRVQQLRMELAGMREFAARLPQLKLLVNQTGRELTKEECRVRALLDEVDNPRNVHRYRRLEGSEPQTQVLFTRVKELQEQLLRKTSEVEEKERLIEEKERLYKELREIISRQPGPEVAEQLNVYQDSLQKKSGQLRAMKDSLGHFQEQVKHYKARFDELQEELRDLNNEYVKARKREEKEHRRQAAINEMLGRPADAPPDAQEEEYTGYTAPPRPPTADSPSGEAGGAAAAGAGPSTSGLNDSFGGEQAGAAADTDGTPAGDLPAMHDTPQADATGDADADVDAAPSAEVGGDASTAAEAGVEAPEGDAAPAAADDNAEPSS
uniref:Cilia- and flagella-associated protein 58 central coiled coil domain-containing protein n=1 Tax=Neobodo designis TaxID=312471 RepID=A0A7S1PLD2_NEODS|mmetsp:Transcript_11441/g.35562  ORF Transcript_11441/g.35562 Transcript_11441/m.35562 type:complete len:976 (+) Transcript_11441:94-3021(+)